MCVGFAEWDAELWTNQHHLMSRLAADNRILFIESLGLRRPSLTTKRDLRRLGRRLVNGLRGPRAVPSPHGGTVWVLSPLVLPLHSVAAVRALNRRLLPALVARAGRQAFPGPRGRRMLWGYVPQAEALTTSLKPDLTIYHCVDDIATQDGIDVASFRAAEARFAGSADLVLTSAPALTERMQAVAANVLFAPNVADTATFSRALEDGPVDPAVDALPEPRIVFCGAISAMKLDFDALAELAHERPQWSIVLVGPIGLGDRSTDVGVFDDVENVHVVGPRPHDELPSVLRGASAGLIPYRRSPLTDAIFPMKVYEYLAAGLPVVATRLPALQDVDAVTTAAGGGSGLAAALDHVLAADDADARRARSAAASTHSWETRLDEIADAVAVLG